MSPSLTAKVAFRPIRADDLPAIAGLLHDGFPKRSLDYWVQGLRRLSVHAPPAGCPHFGYLLAAGDALVGVLLLIFSASPDGTGPAIRGNLSSWYVRPEAGIYAGLLVLRGLKPATATFVNVSPAEATLPIIAAQGFSRFSSGVYAALPALGRFAPARLLARAADWDAAGVPEADRRLLRDHQGFGCVGLWCETEAGGQPFIFRRRRIRPGGIPAAQLIYCRSLEALESVAGPVGRLLAQRGMPLLLAATDRPLRMPGRFYPDKLPMYFRGAVPPRVGDLSYTEAAMIGF
jgi:hypothetical protein